MKKGGFTLIEILIVVAIIAVLASSVLVGFGPAQRQGRDARRISDLRQIQNALELYFLKCGYYPGSAQTGSSCTAYVSLSNSFPGLQAALTASALGVTQIPNDPLSGHTYYYGSDGSGYVLGADLEDTSNNALQNSAQGTLFGVNCSQTSRYCVQF